MSRPDRVVVEMPFPQQSEGRNRHAKGDGSLFQRADGRWYFQMRHNGKRLSKSLGTKDRAEAEKKFRKIRLDFSARIQRGELETSAESNVTVKELLDQYLNWLHKNRPKSVKVMEYSINANLRPWFDLRKVSSIETADCERYQEHRLNQGVTNATVNRELACLRTAFIHESKRTPTRLKKGNVPYIPKLPETNVRRGFIEWDGYERILENLPMSLKALFVCGYHVGTRKGSLLNMKWSDVELADKFIRVDMTKNGEAVNLPIYGDMEDWLGRQKKHRDENFPWADHVFFWYSQDTEIGPEFASGHGGRRSKPGDPIKSFYVSWNTAVEKAGYQGLLFHDLRRSAVRNMVQKAGISEARAMKVSGHKTHEMLRRYNIIHLSDVQQVGVEMDAWAKGQRESRQSAGPGEANG